MRTFDWLKIVAALLVVAAGWWRFEDWKADLRREGEIRILTAAKDSADRRNAELQDSLERVDSIRNAEVEAARVAAEADRERARQAERDADAARARTETVADSVVELYGDTVRAAVQAVRAEQDVERAAWARRATALEQAEARAWAAVEEREAQLADRDVLLVAKDAQLAIRDQIIERWESSGRGHGIVVDVLIGAGGAAVGALGMAAAGG